jgi:Txe/YoeB family toxin of toxin-antitoxin system
MYKLVFTAQAKKDYEKIKQVPALRNKTAKLLVILETEPLRYPPEYEELRYELKGMYSRRINRQHRLVYQVGVDRQEVKIIQMWSHYENI